MISAAAVEAYLRRHIPMALHMEVCVSLCDDSGLRLAAPLAPNVNHRGTVFAGSASSLASLAGWSQVHAHIADLPFAASLVIRRGAIEYDRPIDGDFEAWCPSPGADEWARFQADLRDRGKARIELGVELQRQGRAVASFQGVYVALKE